MGVLSAPRARPRAGALILRDLRGVINQCTECTARAPAYSRPGRSLPGTLPRSKPEES